MARLPKQPKPEFNLDSILNNPVDAKRLKGFIDEALLHKATIRTENEGITDIRNEAKDSLGIPPALFNTLVKTKFNESLEADQEKLDATDLTLSRLYGSSTLTKVNAGSGATDAGDINEEIDGDE